MTEWLPVPGYPDYLVSDDGQVRGPRKLLKLRPDKDGYFRYTPYLNGVQATPKGVHRAVCAAFNGPQPTPAHLVAHRNGNNQDNRAENLYWATYSENALDKVSHGTDPQASKTHCPSGHEYSIDNTYICPNGWRQCRTCKRDLDRKHAHRYRASRNAANRRYRARKKLEKANDGS